VLVSLNVMKLANKIVYLKVNQNSKTCCSIITITLSVIVHSVILLSVETPIKSQIYFIFVLQDWSNGMAGSCKLFYETCNVIVSYWTIVVTVYTLNKWTVWYAVAMFDDILNDTSYTVLEIRIVVLWFFDNGL